MIRTNFPVILTDFKRKFSVSLRINTKDDEPISASDKSDSDWADPFLDRMFSAPMGGATDITADCSPGARTQGFNELRAKGGAAADTVSELVYSLNVRKKVIEK